MLSYSKTYLLILNLVLKIFFKGSWAQWLNSGILGTWKAKIWRITVEGQPKQKSP
jgi:hypothetical protein